MNIDPVLEKIREYSHFIFVQTQEEDVFLLSLNAAIEGKNRVECQVFNPTYGLQNLKDLVVGWKSRTFKPSSDTDLNRVLEKIYTERGTPGMNKIYVFPDPESLMGSNAGIAVRRLVNLAHQVSNDAFPEGAFKIILFVGPTTIVHPKMQRYVEVVAVNSSTSDIEDELLLLKTQYEGKVSFPENEEMPALAKEFAGLTLYETRLTLRRSGRRHKSVNLDVIGEFRREQLKKMDLLSYIDVSDCSFDLVGGAQRFKAWAMKSKVTWTPEGRAFGLTPPRGLLLAGVWGCGKSLSVKALGNAWELPVVQLNLGNLRDSLIGKSEENLHRALKIIEAVSPCIVFMDEAEKGLSGSEASGKTDSGVTSRLIGDLSTWMQETPADICVVMTANSVEALPVEFVRRSNERFFFDLPTEEERVDILKIHLKKRGQVTESLSLATLAEAAKFMVGSEIEQAVEAALIESFHAKTSGISEELLSRELRTKPRIFKMLGGRIKGLLDWVGYDSETDEGIRARFASDQRSEGFKEIYGRP